MALLSQQLATLLFAYSLKALVAAFLSWLMRSLLSEPSDSLLQSLDHAMLAPRWGDPEADENGARACCPGPASELVIVFGMLVLFAVACPWAGILALICRCLSRWANRKTPGRPNIPWRAGSPACPVSDLADDGLWVNTCHAMSWLAAPVVASILVGTAKLGNSEFSAAILGQNGSWEGSDFAPWSLYTFLLLACRFFGRVISCRPRAQKLRLAETRMCCASQRLPSGGHELRRGSSVNRRCTDLIVQTPDQWRDHLQKFGPSGSK